MARTRTLSQLRDDIRYQADIERETRRHPNSKLTRLINQSINAFRLLVSAEGHPYYFKESASANTTAGTADYALPSDMVHLNGVDLTNDNETIALKDYSLVDRNDFSSSVTNDRGVPCAFRAQGANMRLLPTPDAAYAYKFIYLPTVTDLSSDSDTFDGIAGWEDWVVYDVAMKILTREDDDEMLAKVANLKAVREREILASAGKRQRATPIHRRDYRGMEERAERFGS